MLLRQKYLSFKAYIYLFLFIKIIFYLIFIGPPTCVPRALYLALESLLININRLKAVASFHAQLSATTKLFIAYVQIMYFYLQNISYTLSQYQVLLKFPPTLPLNQKSYYNLAFCQCQCLTLYTQQICSILYKKETTSHFTRTSQKKFVGYFRSLMTVSSAYNY